MISHDKIMQNVRALATGEKPPALYSNALSHGVADQASAVRTVAADAASSGCGSSRAEDTQAETIAWARGAKIGVLVERQRIAGILTHANAKGREALARQLALTTEMSVEQAAAAMDKTPSAQSSIAKAVDTAAIYAARAGGAPVDTTDIYAARAGRAPLDTAAMDKAPSAQSSGAKAVDTAAIYAARAGGAPVDTTDIYASRAAQVAAFNRKGE